MILDAAMTNDENRIMLGEKRWKKLLPLRHTAKRYVFDHKATHRLKWFATECADLICQQAHFAIPPFPDTYIEHENIGGFDNGGIGYLFCNDGRIYVIYGNDTDATFTPLVYTSHDAVTETFDNRFNDEELGVGYKALKLVLMVGVTVTDKELNGTEPMPEDKQKAVRRARQLSDLYDVAVTTPYIAGEKATEIMSLIVRECRGDLRWALAAVLLLNQQRARVITEVAPARHWRGNRMVATPRHNVVHIDLDADYKLFHKMFTGSGGWVQIRHEVSGHWYHYNVSAQCKHDWQPFRSAEAEALDIENHGQTLKRYVCSLCGGRRTRKLDFWQGNAEKGTLTKQYKVTASKEQVDGAVEGERDPSESPA